MDSLWNHYVPFWDVLRLELPHTIQSRMAWSNALIERASWCCPCSSTTGGIIGMSCYHVSCTRIELVSTSRPVTLHFVSWWGKSALCHRMFPLLNFVLTGNMTYRHIHSRLGSGMHWRSPTIMFEKNCRGQRPAGSGYTTLRQWIGNSLLDRGCYDTILRRLSTNWDLHGLDLIKSFVRPPVTR